MSAPELVRRNEMYRWGLNAGRKEGILWTLGVVGALAVVGVLFFAWGS